MPRPGFACSFLLAYAASVGSAQNIPTKEKSTENARGKSELELQIRAAERVFNLDDVLRLKFRLSNTEPQTIYLYEVCFDTVKVFSSKKISVPTTFIRECLPPPLAKV
jgi:hypothetical protein